MPTTYEGTTTSEAVATLADLGRVERYIDQRLDMLSRRVDQVVESRWGWSTEGLWIFLFVVMNVAFWLLALTSSGNGGS